MVFLSPSTSNVHVNCCISNAVLPYMEPELGQGLLSATTDVYKLEMIFWLLETLKKPICNAFRNGSGKKTPNVDGLPCWMPKKAGKLIECMWQRR